MAISDELEGGGGAKRIYKEVLGDQQFDHKVYFPNFQILFLLFVPVI